MAQKKRKSKTSSIKRSNQLKTKLQKQGKLKTRRNRAKPKRVSKPAPVAAAPPQGDESNEEEEENVLDMIEEEDMTFLKNAVSNKSYSFLKNLNISSGQEKSKRLKRKAENTDKLEEYEAEYEKSVQESSKVKKKKYLLPIKTSEGIVVRSEDVADSEEEKEKSNVDTTKGNDDEEEEVDSDGDDEDNFKIEINEEDDKKEMSVADLLAKRQNSLMKSKFRIGNLCSGLTENPEVKIKNFVPLLEMLSANDPEVCITVKKLALISILEVFKDLIPGYQIRHHDDSKVKLKKAVKQLQGYENALLKYYKEYLKKLEKMVSILKRKKGDNRIFKEAELKLAEMALSSLCELLKTHPDFNFSKNIIHLLVPFLNSSKDFVRTTVSDAIKEIFKNDKKGEVSLEIVRNINKLVKSKKNIVHSEVLSVCLALKIKDVNLDKEKEEELKKKKETAMKHKFLKLSKRERKRKKKFQALEKELLETKAEEDKKSKQHYMTEITKILFTIYFRILKVTPSSKLLNAALEGLAKFAHCINIDFYQDLILVLGNLIQNENMRYKEKLCCVQTVFTVLFYQGATISIDPIKFYSHFYANILQINAGKNHCDLPLIIKTTDFVLLKRRKHLSLQRLLAFTKRLTALALQVLPNGALALLSSIKQILQVNNSTDLLLDLDSNVGQGVYYPEMNEPEYCNASATSLWELLLLQRHYHPTVREFASYIAKSGHKNVENSEFKSFLKRNPEQLYEDFDPTNVKFNPPVPPPRNFSKVKRRGKHLVNENLEEYINTTLKEQKIQLFNSNFKSLTTS